MDRDLAERLAATLASIDAVRGQFGEAAHGERTANFYSLVPTIQPRPNQRAVPPADVIALTGGSVLIVWHDPDSWAVFPSINSLRLMYAATFRLELDDTAERVFKPGVTIADLLTPKERVLMKLLRLGLTNKEIAQRLGLSVSTIKNRLTFLFGKLEVLDRFGAVVMTINWNLDAPEAKD